MFAQEYLLEMETPSRVCPNCSSQVEHVDRYGNSWDETSEACYCQSCGFPFEAA